MVVAMFLTKHLLIDWRRGEKWFNQHLIDSDFASNNGGWQWASSTGTDAQPYFRIFHPVTQGVRFDKDCVFIRRHVPELRSIPASSLHAPWEKFSVKQLEKLGYAGPIIDHKEARARALAEFRRLKDMEKPKEKPAAQQKK